MYAVIISIIIPAATSGRVGSSRFPWPPAEVDAIGKCIKRGTPYGCEKWVRLAAKNHGLESTLRPRGRPRKEAAEEEGEK
jgi:putative transposase